MLRNYLDSPTNATPTFDGSLQTHCCSARVHCTTLAVAKLCLPTFLRQIALYSPGCRSVGCRHVLVPLVLPQ